MGYYSDDVYNNPEKFGLTVIGEIEWSEPCYSFDMTVVWKNDSGEYYVGSDSGCSCPSPFEDCTSLDTLEGPFTKTALIYTVDKMVDRQADEKFGYGRAELTRQAKAIYDRL